MPKKTLPLTDTEIKNAKPGEKPRKLFDGAGLFLLIEPSGAKGWRLKYRYGGKEKLISLGVYPAIPLKKAREERDKYRGALERGIDPSLAKKSEKEEEAKKAATTFEAVAREWQQTRSALAPKTAYVVRRRLELDILPPIGKVPVADLTPKMILNGVLRPMERRGAVELAHRARSIISQILRYAVACDYVERDVSADLKGAIQPFKRTSHMAAPAKDPKAAGAILRAIDGYDGSPIVAAALRLHPLVATRPGELRHMEWAEIDLEEGLWSIPAGKMKMRVDHVVPLSRQAVAILEGLRPLTGGGRYVFPSVRSTSRPISDNTLNAAHRRLGIGKEELVSHGWRAVFRTLADEVLQERVDFIEHQLAHVVKDPNGRAYNRTAFLADRERMMQRWADYLDGLKAGGKVIPLHRTA